MRRLLLALCALIALPVWVAPALAADNTILLTPCSSGCVTVRSKDIGGGVESTVVIPGDTGGTPLATAPGSGNTSFALPIQGVASGVAVPMSAASLPLPTGAATSANQSSQITQETATAAALGTTADSVCGTATGTCSLVALSKYNNNALASAIPAGTNVIGFVSSDPCAQGVKVNVPISTASGTTALVTGVSAKKIYVCSFSLIASAAATVSLSEGSGTTCGTSAQAGVIGVATNGTSANGLSLAANGGLTLGSGAGSVAQTATAANYLCLFQAGTVQMAGNLTYVQQ